MKRRPVVLFLAAALVLAALATPLLLPAAVLDSAVPPCPTGIQLSARDACPEAEARPAEADPVAVLQFRGPPTREISAVRGSKSPCEEAPWNEREVGSARS